MDNPLRDNNRVLDLSRKGNLYLSPEAFRAAVMKQAPSASYSIAKSDVFSNGLVLLAASLLESFEGLYRFDLEELDREFLLKKLSSLKKRYPQNLLFLTTVNKMLDFNPSTRPTFQELVTSLPEYQQVKSYFAAYPDTLLDEENLDGNN